MSISLSQPANTFNHPKRAAQACRPEPPYPSPGETNPDAVVTYCTSEQMDLWRQVFAEADHRARRLSAMNSLRQERKQ
jgi:hypothetical protein